MILDGSQLNPRMRRTTPPGIGRFVSTLQSNKERTVTEFDESGDDLNSETWIFDRPTQTHYEIYSALSILLEEQS